eukprot:1387184-Amphidinium_carterae.1
MHGCSTEAAVAIRCDPVPKIARIACASRDEQHRPRHGTSRVQTPILSKGGSDEAGEDDGANQQLTVAPPM